MQTASLKQVVDTYLENLQRGLTARGKSMEDFNITKITMQDLVYQLEKKGWKLCKVV